ncbi:galactose-binding like protein [Backusella circina FSU 941]|nr:galactose-binding like protein [Backusella circina FSU 941]
MGNSNTKHELPFEYMKTQSLEQTSFANQFEVSLARRQAIILAVTDEQFGEAKNLLKADSVNTQDIQSEGTIDGWQVRRHLNQAIVHVRLCGSCHIKGVDIDTTGYAKGTSALSICLDGLSLLDNKNTWINLIPHIEIKENRHNYFAIHQNGIYDTLRLTVLPGGGISRFRVYGVIIPIPIFDGIDRNMASGGLGAQVLKWNNDAAECVSDILYDGDETEESGWLTPRSRKETRNDAVIIKLAAVSMINRIIVNTRPFLDKAPDAVSLDVCFSQEDDDVMQHNKVIWYNVIKREKIIPNCKQTILCRHHLPVSHIRLTLLPDGGIQQIKVIGYAYYGSYGDILDANTIETRSFCNSTFDTEEPPKLIKNPVPTIETGIQQEKVIKEEPVFSKDVVVNEKFTDTASPKESSPLREEEPQISKDIAVGSEAEETSQPQMVESCSVEKEISASEQVTETHPDIHSETYPEIDIETEEINEVDDGSPSSEMTYLFNVDQGYKEAPRMIDDSSSLSENILSPVNTDPAIIEEEVPEMRHSHLPKKQIKSQPILTTAVDLIAKGPRHHPPIMKDVQIEEIPKERSPLDEDVVPNDTTTTAVTTDVLMNPNCEGATTENKQNNDNTLLKNVLILRDILQYKNNTLTKGDVKGDSNISKSKMKRKDNENMALVSKSIEPTVDQNTSLAKYTPNTGYTASITPVAIAAMASAIILEGYRSGEKPPPTPHRQCLFPDKFKIESISTVPKQDHHQSTVHAAPSQHASSQPFFYTSYNNNSNNNNASPSTTKDDWSYYYTTPMASYPPPINENVLPPVHTMQPTQKKDNKRRTNAKKEQVPQDVSKKHKDATPPRTDALISEITPQQQPSPSTSKFAKPKRVPTVLVETNSSSDEDDEVEEEYESGSSDRPFPKLLTIPQKRRRS